MKYIWLVALVLLCRTATAQQTASIEIGSDYTLLFEKLPIKFKADEGGAYYDWDITGTGVKSKTESFNELQIDAIANGDYEASVKVLIVDFEAEKTFVQESKVKFRVDIRGPPEQPEQPEIPDTDALKALTIKLATEINDPTSAKLLAKAYEKTSIQIKDITDMEEVQAIATRNAGDAMQFRQGFGVQWNPMFKTLWAEMVKMEADTSVVMFKAAIQSIAEGLTEASE